jgi:hypothetical protein
MTRRATACARRIADQALRRTRLTAAAAPRPRVRLATTFAAASLALGLGACTAITPEVVKEHESAGTTRRYDRPASDLYTASVAAIDIVRNSSNYWNQLAIVERDPAKGTVIAEQNLESAVVPGLGTRDAIGIFVKDVPPDDSDVTVVVMGSDQMPGTAGTSVASWPTASSSVFPAIDQALESMPAKPRTAAAPAPAAAPARPVAPRAPSAAPPSPAPAAGTPAAPVAAPAPPPAAIAPAAPVATGGGVLDRVYDVLHASGTWRPLVRETGVDGSEEVRIGSWATLRDKGDGGVRLIVHGANAPAADAARLALELSQAGFTVTVESDTSKHRSR